MRFFLVDRVEELRPGERIRGVKCVSLSDEILQDHFPDHPLFPGTLLVEALAQLGGCLVEATVNRDPGEVHRAVLGQVDRARFHAPARPGDRIELRCRLLSRLAGAALVEGEAGVEGRRIAGAELTFVLEKVDSEKVHQQRRALYAVWTRDLALDFPLI